MVGLEIVTLSLPVPPQPVITSINNVTESPTTDNITVQWTFEYGVVSTNYLILSSLLHEYHYTLVSYISYHMTKLSMNEYLNTCTVFGCVYPEFL